MRTSNSLAAQQKFLEARAGKNKRRDSTITNLKKTYMTIHSAQSGGVLQIHFLGEVEQQTVGHRGIPNITAGEKANIFCQTFSEKCRCVTHHNHRSLAYYHHCVLATSTLNQKMSGTFYTNLDPGKASGSD